MSNPLIFSALTPFSARLPPCCNKPSQNTVNYHCGSIVLERYPFKKTQLVWFSHETRLNSRPGCPLEGTPAQHFYKVCNHEDTMAWKNLPHYWPFLRGIHQSPDAAFSIMLYNTIYYVYCIKLFKTLFSFKTIYPTNWSLSTAAYS